MLIDRGQGDDRQSAGTYDFATLNAAYDANFVDGGTGSITVLPEPATMSLLLVGAMGVVIRRRRRS